VLYGKDKKRLFLLHKYTKDILQNQIQGVFYALAFFYLEEFIKAE
jgi:hypothetical protein